MIIAFSEITFGATFRPTSLTLVEVHLLRCLTIISQRYLAQIRSLVISSPAAYRDVQQELIAEIHRNSNWPVVVTVDVKISVYKKSEFIDRDGSYITFTPDGYIDSIDAEILGLMLGRKNEFTQIWNSESRFVVAGANELSVSHQTDLLVYFSQLRIYYFIFVNEKYNVILKEYSRPTNGNDVGTGKELGVYTWFPYHSSDRCTEVNHITLIDS